MIRRAVFAVLVLVCLSFFFLFPGNSTSKSPVAEKAKPSAVQPATQKEPATISPSAVQKDPALIIEKIYLKGNKIFVTINRKAGERVAPDDYSKIMMRVETSKGARQWSLAEVDRKKILSGNSGKVEFDTGIVLEKGEMVKAVLSLGKWETSRRDNLVITAASAGTKPGLSKMTPSKMTEQGKLPAQPSGQTTMMMARAINARSTTPTPTPRNLDDSGGIRVTNPGGGQIQRPGDRVPVMYTMLREVGAGPVEISLRKFGVTDTFATGRIGYNPAVGEVSTATSLTLPSRGLSPGANYYISAVHPEAWGLSDAFTIQSPGEGQIRVLRPRAGEGVTPGFAMNVDYQFTRHASEGQINFELYKLDAGGGYGRPIRSFTRHYRPSLTSPAEPIIQVQWPLPRDFPVGQYFVQATHPEAWGKSSNFSVRWEGEGHDFPSAYAVADIFKRGRDIKARIRATGGDIADYVELDVNGVLRREVIRPSGDTEIDVGPAWEVCGNFNEVILDPNHRIRSASMTSLRKFVPTRNPDGYVISHDILGDTVAIPCDPTPHSSGDYGSIWVILHNCSSASLSTNNLVEVRQMGWIPATMDRPERQLDVVRPHLVRVADCNSLHTPRAEPSIPPGECGIVRVSINDLQRLDGWLVFTFRGDAVASWPSLTNPYQIKLKFGHWGTTINTRTGETTRECVYHEESHP